MLRLAVLVLAGWVAGAQAAPPSAVSASYELRMNGASVAVVDERYEARNGSYQLTSRSTPVGVFSLVPKLALRFTSTGAVGPEGLRPARFEGRRAGNATPEVSAGFDWPAGSLTLVHRGRTETAALPDGAQDRLSVMYQFMFLAPPQREVIEVDVTNGRSLSRYRYAVRRNVEQETPLGRLTTVHLVRQRDAGDSVNEIWLSPEHGYLPVRMIIVERDGTRYEQLAARLELQP
jgi:hypothetical protein